MPTLNASTTLTLPAGQALLFRAGSGRGGAIADPGGRSARFLIGADDTRIGPWTTAVSVDVLIFSGSVDYIVDLSGDDQYDQSTALVNALMLSGSGLTAGGNSLTAVQAAQVRAGMRLKQFGLKLNTVELSDDVPTVTLGTAGAASTISGGLHVHLRKVTASVYDTETDPQIEIVGCPQGVGIVDAGDCLRGDYLTGGLAQARRWLPGIRVVYSSDEIEVGIRAFGNSAYRVWVNGKPTSDSFTSLTMTASSRYWLKLAFGSAKSREVQVEFVGDIDIRGVVIKPTATLMKPASRRPRLSFFGDSLTAGAIGIGPKESCAAIASELLGCENWNLSIGGSGVFAGSPINTRIATDVASVQPDILVFWANQNDRATNTMQAIADQTALDIRAIKAASPDTVILLVGSSNQDGDATDANGEILDGLLRGVATAEGAHFISVRDPLDVLSSTAAFSAAEANIVGDLRSYNGFVWRCIVAKSGGAAWSRTNWRSTAVLNGTGRVGTETGFGNRDLLIGASDNVHGLLAWHQVFGQFFAQRIYQALG
jgi:hypothetical protein